MVNTVKPSLSALITTKGNLRSGQFAWNSWKVSHTQLHFGDGFLNVTIIHPNVYTFDSFFGCQLKFEAIPKRFPCLSVILCLLKRLMRIYKPTPKEGFCVATALLLSSSFQGNFLYKLAMSYTMPVHWPIFFLQLEQCSWWFQPTWTKYFSCEGKHRKCLKPKNITH